MVAYSHENTFDKSQQLYMILELLLVMEKMNQEKMIELDKEAKHKGRGSCFVKGVETGLGGQVG